MVNLIAKFAVGLLLNLSCSGNENSTFHKCPPGYYLRFSAITKRNAICIPCPAKRFTDKFNLMFRCKPCKTHCLGENEIIISECSRTQDLMCSCEKNFWHEKIFTTNAKCLPHTQCSLGFELVQPGTILSDTICKSCIEGTTYYNLSIKKCLPCQKCDIIVRPCTRMANAICAETKLVFNSTSNQPSLSSINILLIVTLCFFVSGSR